MKYFPIIFFLIVGHCSFAQDKNILQQKKYFDQELKLWTNTFSNFKLSDFKVKDTLHFDNNFQQDFKSYRKFLSIYKPIITYSADSSKFIDIYSYQINLERKGKYYEANPDVDQAVLLCDPKTKYWDRVYFGTSSQWIDEVIWISKTKFILVGIIKETKDKRMPLILFGDTNKQTLVEYLTVNKNSFQNDKGYSSPKLKKMKIKGL
jgi:hypothetical protein